MILASEQDFTVIMSDSWPPLPEDSLRKESSVFFGLTRQAFMILVCGKQFLNARSLPVNQHGHEVSHLPLISVTLHHSHSHATALHIPISFIWQA